MGVAAVLVVLAAVFVTSALSLPPQLRSFSLYSYLVAGLLVICSVAAWRGNRLPRMTLPARTARGMSIAQWLITGLVWSYPASLYVYAGVACAIVGHWPSYGHPDPKELQLPVLHWSVIISFFASTVAVLLWALSIPISSRALGLRGVRLHVLVFVLGLGALADVFLYDPGGVGEWYAD